MLCSPARVRTLTARSGVERTNHEAKFKSNSKSWKIIPWLCIKIKIIFIIKWQSINDRKPIVEHNPFNSTKTIRLVPMQFFWHMLSKNNFSKRAFIYKLTKHYLRLFQWKQPWSTLKRYQSVKDHRTVSFEFTTKLFQSVSKRPNQEAPRSGARSKNFRRCCKKICCDLRRRKIPRNKNLLPAFVYTPRWSSLLEPFYNGIGIVKIKGLSLLTEKI